MQRACLALIVALGLAAPAKAAETAEADKEPVLEVDLGSGNPTETPVPTSTPVPPTPTPAPTAAPTLAATPAVGQPQAASPAAEVEINAAETPAPDLNEVRFDKGGAEDGLMIIAPGAASPEDSLESFGIDSPFNWKGRDRKVLQPGKPGEDEGLELAAPEASDLRERVSVETSEGSVLPSDADYDKVERAGLVLGASEYRVDGRISRTRDGKMLARRNSQVSLRMEPGRQVYPGSVYTVFREGRVLRTAGENSQDVGMQVSNVGVLRVIRLEGEEVLARVEKQYQEIREGDLVRLRDPDRLKFYNSLRQGGPQAPLELKGEVLGFLPPALQARRGDVVYLDLGRAKGAAPGMRLLVTREPGGDEVQGLKSVEQTGRVGLLEVLNVSRDASVARVVQAVGNVRLGDKVRYR